MKILRILFWGGLCLILFLFFERGWKDIPPLGNLLSPQIGFWNQSTNKKIISNQEVQVSDLIAEVRISFDTLNIPRIFASNESDLYFAQGYLHAKNRLWQMDFQVRAAGGDLAEILGSQLIDYDRTARRKGMHVAAKTALERELKHPDSQIALIQYTNGVNAYIETLTSAAMPLEFKLLNYKPSLWTPEKTMLMLLQMVATLSTTEYDIENTRFLLENGEEAFNLLFPDVPSFAYPIISNPGNWPFPVEKTDSITDLWPEGFDMTTRNNPFTEDVPGSNNWVVGPTKTTDGTTILCNDPHLGLQLPSLLFINQLSSNTNRIIGASIPGIPGVVLGYNDSIAWGVTNSQRDVVDWYKILFKDAKRNAYLLDGEWEPTKKVIEEIIVAGQNKIFDTVIYTEFGPIVYDENFKGKNARSGLAYRWIGHDTNNELTAFIQLNKAKNKDQIIRSLSKMTSVAQNFAYATVAGEYGMCISGKYPLRHQGEGRFIRDGKFRVNNWNAFVPFEGNPKESNPTKGFVASANQHHADQSYPYYQYATPYQTYRNRRINQVLETTEKAGVEEMLQLQNDNFNVHASLCLPIIFETLPDSILNETERKFINQLKIWNLENDPMSEGAIYFEEVWKDFYKKSLLHLYSDSTANNRLPQSFTLLEIMATSPKHQLWDDPNTTHEEVLETHLRKALNVAIKNVEHLASETDFKWYIYKNTTLRHLARIPEFSKDTVYIGGNTNIVNANTSTHGASWRFLAVVDSSKIRGMGIYPGGQDGNPGGSQYTQYVKQWQKGKLLPLPLEEYIDSYPTLLLKPNSP